MIAPKSQSLFHFTRTPEVLESILENGFFPRYCLEDISWLPLDDDHMAFPMVCFCDIPIGRISEHTSFYGEYGLGLTKQWGLKNNLSPIAYTHSTGGISELLRYLINTDNDKLLPDEDLRDEIFERIYKQHSLMKPISGKMLIGGKAIEKDFYQESEWRYTPEGSNVIFQDDFDKDKHTRNAEMQASKLEISPADIKYVFVKSETDIPRLYDFIHKAMGRFPHAEVKALVTRIISLETIAGDF